MDRRFMPPLTDDYRKEIARVFAGAVQTPVYNGTLDHAAIVIEEGFKAADNTVRILSNHLDASCYARPETRTAARAFLGRPGAQLKILVENDTGLNVTGDSFLSEVYAAAPDRVSIHKVSENLLKQYKYNFMVVDDKGYRFQEDRNEHVAVIAGGPENHAGVMNLIGIFDVIDAASATAPIVVPI